MLLRTRIHQLKFSSRILLKISELAYRWKMSFNLHPLKQAQEVFFSNKAIKTNHPSIKSNGNKVQNIVNQKHLGLILDE